MEKDGLMDIREQIDRMPDASDVYVGKNLTVSDVRRSMERLLAVYEAAIEVVKGTPVLVSDANARDRLRDALARVQTSSEVLGRLQGSVSADCKSAVQTGHSVSDGQKFTETMNSELQDTVLGGP